MKALFTAILLLLCFWVNAQEDISGNYYVPPEICGFTNPSYELRNDGTFYYSYTSGNCYGYTSHVGHGKWEKVDNALFLQMMPYRPIETISEVFYDSASNGKSSFRILDENGELVTRDYQVRLYHKDHPNDFTVFFTDDGILEFDSKKYSHINPLNLYWSLGEKVKIPINSNMSNDISFAVELPAMYLSNNEIKWKYYKEPIILQLGDDGNLYTEDPNWYFKKYIPSE